MAEHERVTLPPEARYPGVRAEPPPHMTAAAKRQQRILITVVLLAALAMAAPAIWGLYIALTGLATPVPPPITYEVSPLQVEQTVAIHAGDIVPLLPVRCVTDDGGTGLGRLPFWFTARLIPLDRPREIVDDVQGGFSQADVGCHQTRQTQVRVPDKTPPGHYYLEGTTTATGARRAATVGWRSEIFEVVP